MLTSDSRRLEHACLRCATVQAAFEAVGQVDQGQADREVDERRRDQRRPVEGLGLQDPRRAQELGETYDRDEGGIFHQGYELVGQGRYRPPEGLGHDDVAHRLGVGEAGGASGLHLPLVDALDAGAEDLCDVGRAVQAERHQPGEEQALEPEADRGGREVDDGYLHQKRRPPEHVYVGLGGPAQYPRAADLEQGEHQAQDYPENLRQEGERDSYEHALQDSVEVVEDYLEVQVVGLESLEVEAARVELDRHHCVSSSLRYLLRFLAEPLLVYLGVGAVLLYLLERLVGGLEEIAVLGEGYAVLLAGQDGLHDFERSATGLGPVGGDREVVYDGVYLAVLQRREGLRDGVEGPHFAGYLPLLLELFRLQFSGGAQLHPDDTVADVVYRLDGRAALDHERLVGVEVRIGEVDLLLACLGYGHRRGTRVVEVVAKAGDDPVEGDVLELGREACPLADLAHQVYVEAHGLSLLLKLEGRVCDVRGDRDLLASATTPAALATSSTAAACQDECDREDERYRDAPVPSDSHGPSSPELSI